MLFTTPALGGPEQRVLGDIDGLRAQLRLYTRDARDWTGFLRRQTFARNMKGSNSIEGYNASIDDAVAIASDEEPLDVDTETRAALEGYREAMTYILQLADDDYDELSADLVRSLHYMMLRHELSKRPGRWRLGAVYVTKEATGERVYEGPPADAVPDLMREFVNGLRHNDGPPVVRAAMAHLNLVMIHPFRDGNGRMARAVQTLILARQGILAPEFCSVEEYLGRQTQPYYDVLAEVGGGAWQPHRDARPWLRFMLKAHYSQAVTLLRRVDVEQRVWDDLEELVRRHALPERCVGALAFASAGFQLRRTRYVIEADVEEATASRDLGRLAAAGVLDAHGEKRGRFYTASPQVRRIRERARQHVGGFAVIDPFNPEPGLT